MKKIEKKVKASKKQNEFIKYVENNLYIRTKGKSIGKFVFNKEQKVILKKIEEQRKKKGKVRLIILKGRQIGVSTFISALGYYNMIQKKGHKSMVLAHRQSAANNMFDMVKRYLDKDNNINKKEILITRNKSILLKDQDSNYTFATARSTEVGRSDTLQFFHGSEVAFWSYEENHLSSILMAVSDEKGSEVILESTSSGAKGMFYEMCQEAIKGQSEFEILFFPWYSHLDYQSYEDITLPQGWLEYGAKYNLKQEQIKWAYIKNKTLTLGGEDYNLGPSDRFYREFPASIAEAFKYSRENIFIKLENINKITLNKDFYKQGGDKTKAKVYQYELAKRQEIILGVDIARGGGDLSWIIDRQGDFIGFNVNQKIDVKDTMEVAGWILKYIKQLQPRHVCIDAGGGGIGVYDRLREQGYDDILILVNFASKADDDRKYLNKRAEIWGRLKDFVDESGEGIINDELLIQQISSVEYHYTSKGQIQLESKDNIKKKLKHSPDGGDACALTFATNSYYRGSGGKVTYSNMENNFDPFNW